MLETAPNRDCRVAGSDGELGHVGYLCTVEQILRWSGLGFDATAALDRTRTFVKTYRATADYKVAGRALIRFLEDEHEFAISQGVPVNDPDLWRIISSHKAWVWDFYKTA